MADKTEEEILREFTGGGVGNLPEEVFDPGKDERERGQAIERENIENWRELYNLLPQNQDLQTTPQVIYAGPDGTPVDAQGRPIPANTFDPYQVGDALVAPEETFLTPAQANALGLSPESAASGATSAYDDLGPSAYADLVSEFEGMAPSAYQDLGVDPGSMEGLRAAEDYFAGVQETGYDAISEADYARAQSQAEQMRRSQNEAALADAEMRGVGGIGNVMQAELVGNQGMVSDLHQAGLDRAAQAAGRRDSAATSRADVAELYGRMQLDADALRAAGLDEHEIARLTGLDTFATDQAAGLDTYGTNVAGGQDDFETSRFNAMDDFANERYGEFYDVQEGNVDRSFDADTKNWEHENTVSAANTEMENELTWYNNVTGPQTQFDNAYRIQAGTSGAAIPAASNSYQSGGAPFDPLRPIQMTANTAANVAKASKNPGGS